MHKLEMRKITKYFPDVNALSDVDFRLMKGEVHAIMGQNGAGKSTFNSRRWSDGWVSILQREVFSSTNHAQIRAGNL